MAKKIKLTFKPRCTCTDSLTVNLLQEGDQGSLLLMKDDGDLFLAGAKTTLEDPAGQFELTFRANNEQVRLRNCKLGRCITGHFSTYTVDGKHDESSNEIWWTLESVTDGDESVKRLYLQDMESDNQKLLFYIEHGNTVNDEGIKFKLGKEDNKIVTKMSIFEFTDM